MAHEDEVSYVAEAIVCHACAAGQRAAHDAMNDNHGKPPPGFYFPVRQQVNGRRR